MNIWLTIILAGILTYAIRLSLLVLQDRIRMPDLIQRGLRFVPPAVFTAVFLPEMFLNDGVLNLSPGTRASYLDYWRYWSPGEQRMLCSQLWLACSPCGFSKLWLVSHFQFENK